MGANIPTYVTFFGAMKFGSSIAPMQEQCPLWVMSGHFAVRSRHCRRTPLPAPVQELLLEHGFIGQSKTGFGRVRYQHVDASGTPIDNG